MKDFTTTFHAYKEGGTEVESCFTVSVSEDLTKEAREDLIFKISTDMAKLQGYSDEEKYIVQQETGTEYEEAIDLYPCLYTYAETERAKDPAVTISEGGEEYVNPSDDRADM